MQAYLYMITDCPTSFWTPPPFIVNNRFRAYDNTGAAIIRDKCERSPSDGHPYTYHLDLPVHSMASVFNTSMFIFPFRRLAGGRSGVTEAS